jgi:hypothetical protein
MVCGNCAMNASGCAIIVWNLLGFPEKFADLETFSSSRGSGQHESAL